MTGGRVVVLGRTGWNFGAGMSGGVAYVLDVDGDFALRCNREMVDLETLVDASEIDLVQNLIMTHVAVTGSTYAEGLLSDWRALHGRLVKVMPREYKRALAEQAAREERARVAPVVEGAAVVEVVRVAVTVSSGQGAGNVHG
jgi:glutamate synthase domain-containing protein 3